MLEGDNMVLLWSRLVVHQEQQTGWVHQGLSVHHWSLIGSQMRIRHELKGKFFMAAIFFFVLCAIVFAAKSFHNQQYHVLHQLSTDGNHMPEVCMADVSLCPMHFWNSAFVC